MARIPRADVDGIRLKSFILAGSKWLSHHRFYLDKINFFPVPDGDTGANMYLTMTAVCAHLRTLENFRSTSEVARQAAMGALMGSKGNSGIILAQYFRGFSESLGSKKTIKAYDIAKALLAAAKTAREGVHKPREGTILSLARDAADACVKHSGPDSRLIDVLSDFYKAAAVSLEKTRRSLPENRKAGVVDSGANGLFLIFEGIMRVATGRSVKTPPKLEFKNKTSLKPAAGRIQHKYCASFILKKKKTTTDTVFKNAIKKFGSSIVIDKGIKNISKIHVHTNEPDELLEKAAEFGLVENVNIEDMKQQVSKRNKA